MKTFILILLTICLAMPALSVTKIDIYIESLCPYCMALIANSFKPFHANPSKDQLAEVNFYSYGNAHETWDGSKWVFQCQHGDNECYGNIIETCAQAKLDKETYHTFLICLEGDIKKTGKDFNQSLKNCMCEDGVKDVLACVNSEEGNKLEHEIAQKTPVHKGVPWIVVDGIVDENIQGEIFDNMTKYLCKGKPELEGCKNHQQSSSSETVMFEFTPYVTNFLQMLE
jgi:interferon gamma-inducible protein 30